LLSYIFRGEKFRPTFSRLGEIRSHLTETPFLLLTATLTKEILLSVCKKLHIEHPAIVAKSPERYLQHHTNHLSA
jgi:superfamily II DNA helicase RecQ